MSLSRKCACVVVNLPAGNGQARNAVVTLLYGVRGLPHFYSIVLHPVETLQFRFGLVKAGEYFQGF